MTKITKREFISLLKSAPSLLCGVELVGEIIPDKFDAVLSEVDRLNPLGYDLREVVASRSNHLEFSDGSRLYFDAGVDRMYFRVGSALAVVIHEKSAPMFKVLVYKLRCRNL